MSGELEYIEGGIVIDERGQIQFCNSFNMKDIRRFYIIENHEPQFIRAWHGHKKETKCAFVISGAALIAALKIDNWVHPDKSAVMHRHILSEKKPGILKIPAGFAHGFKTLTIDTKIMFFSTLTLEESLTDDYRYKFDYWNPWEVKPR